MTKGVNPSTTLKRKITSREIRRLNEKKAALELLPVAFWSQDYLHQMLQSRVSFAIFFLNFYDALVTENKIHHVDNNLIIILS